MPVKKLKNHPHIYERISDDGTRLTGYQVKIRRQGFPHYAKTFDDLEEAKAAVLRVKLDQAGGLTIDRLKPEKITVADVLKKRIADIEAGRYRHKSKDGDLYRLQRIVRDDDLACFTLANLRAEHWQDWITYRLESVAPSTIKRDLAILRPMFRTLCIELQITDCLAGVKNPTVMDERIRRFRPGEEARLFAEISAAQNPWVLPAAVFALESGCRRSELLAVEWEDYSPRDHTIWLSTAKNGRGRFILLTEKAEQVLLTLPGANMRAGKIFDTTADTIKQAFERARERAGMPDFRWHDFRHEAISRLFDDGWKIDDVMDFSGHVDVKSLLRYRHTTVSKTVSKLRDTEKRREFVEAAE
jgi:integrase